MAADPPKPHGPLPRAFHHFLGVRLTGTAANQMLLVALGWQMYDLTASAWDLGLVGLVQFVPALLLTIPAGLLVDRVDRRGVLIAEPGAAGAGRGAPGVVERLRGGEPRD